jgi:hypothetical protein
MRPSRLWPQLSVDTRRQLVQRLRALSHAVDAGVERLILAAPTPDRIVLAIAALGEIQEETRAIRRQWSLKRERARQARASPV